MHSLMRGPPPHRAGLPLKALLAPRAFSSGDGAAPDELHEDPDAAPRNPPCWPIENSTTGERIQWASNSFDSVFGALQGDSQDLKNVHSTLSLFL